jgi:capsular polysaccharide export protein
LLCAGGKVNNFYITFSPYIFAKKKRIENFFDIKLKYIPFYIKKAPKNVRGIIYWGREKNTEKYKEIAEKLKLSAIAIENGFIRSMGLPREGYKIFSMVWDDKGIYFDATCPSRLELILNDNHFTATNDELIKAKHAINLITEFNITKYNSNKEIKSSTLLKDSNEKILVIDQTSGDLSIQFGECGHFTFKTMLETAIKENPSAKILIKLHPETITGHKNGNLTCLSHPRVEVIKENINPIALLKLIDKVYVMTSQMGFEALLLNKKVICFGTPFYSGWGLTDDRVLCERRTKKRTVEEIFIAAYIKYCLFKNPITNKESDLFEILHYIINYKKSHITGRSGNICFWDLFKPLYWIRKRKLST